ncbi:MULTISPECIES: hypothetical protein [unclassified Pseudoalteromonas]|uniref:hypothetical protein n=1 Tax=unclassified Pseudoalteromonas TaxID=194690 RepID=UPI0005A9A3F5|nr:MULTISPECIES: hypothetical protein [unclassified Pseudoalteromonas]
MKSNNFLSQSIHLIVAFIFSLMIAILYYKINIINIDPYDQFIYGDTINASYSKLTDYRFLLILFSLFLFSFFIFDKFKVITKCINGYSSLLTFLPLIKSNKFTSIIFDFLLVVLFSYLSSKVLFSIIGWEHYSTFNRNVFIISIMVISLSFKQRAPLVSQLFFSVSPLVYLNESYIFNGDVIHFPPSDNLSYLIYFISLITLIISINDVMKNNSKINFSFLVFVCVALIGEGSRIYALDEYHLGEVFTNFHQGITLNQAYYSEYIPTKGFMHTFTGLLNNTFYDGGYTTIGLSLKLSALITVILALGVLGFFYSKFILLILLCIGLPFTGHYAPILIGICILSSKRVVNDSYNFMIASLLFSFFYFVYYNAFAIAFGLVILPILIYHLKEIVIHKYHPNKLQSISFIIGMLILIFLFNYITSSVAYVLSNSSSNLFYWGNSGTFESLLKSNLWVLIPIVLSFLIYTKNLVINKDNILWLCFFIIFPFVILSYLEGRADGRFSRAFLFTAFCAPMIFAFINNKSVELNKVTKLILSSLFIIIYFITSNPAWIKIKGINNFHRVFSDKGIDNKHILIDENEIPNLGDGFIKKRRYQDLKNEYELISNLSSNETFLLIDKYVTQSARYSIYDKLTPTLNHSILNVSSLELQNKELVKVKNSNVEIIRVSNGVRRYHLFFNYLSSLNFKFISFKGRDYLVSPEVFSSIENKLDFIVNNSFEQKYSTNQFGLLPIKWGSALSNQLSNLVNARVDESFSKSNSINNFSNIVSGKDPWLLYDIKNQLRPLEIDLINLNFSLSKDVICNSQLFWDDGGGFSEAKSIRFNIGNGDNVIPIHMNYDWRTSSEILGIRVDIDSCNNKKVTLNKIEAYKYNFHIKD